MGDNISKCFDTTESETSDGSDKWDTVFCVACGS